MLVSVGDVRLFVDIDGAKLVPAGDSMLERPTIVMLHGNGADHSPFKEFYGGFTDFAQVVYCDLRGHGRSDDGEPESWNLEQWADDLLALCEALGIDRPVVWGFSFGGAIALNYAIRYPDHPAKLVVACSAGHIDPDASIRMFEQLGGADIAAVARTFYAAPADTWEEFFRVCSPYFSTLPPRPERGARIVAPRLGVTEHFLRHEYLQHDHRDRAAAIRCPTLFLAGELDPIVPIQVVDDMASRMQPGVATVVRFPDAGHGMGGQPTAIDVVRDFVLQDP